MTKRAAPLNLRLAERTKHEKDKQWNAQHKP